CRAARDSAGHCSSPACAITPPQRGPAPSPPRKTTNAGPSCQWVGSVGRSDGERYALDRLVAPEPALEEGGEPVAGGEIVDEAVGEVLVALLGAGKFHAMRAAHEPAVHHRVRHFRVELQR